MDEGRREPNRRNLNEALQRTRPCQTLLECDLANPILKLLRHCHPNLETAHVRLQNGMAWRRKRMYQRQNHQRSYDRRLRAKKIRLAGGGMTR